ncbi:MULTISPECIES: hypothetical protein [unclassified Apibacter]|uniref:hypothetical protein n=1 Tax=unclassified Apibacter TaxID=2630820 RepID=UPI00132A53C0|nr:MULTISPECIES: hypothetical protein [unclassified Apibacter]MCX8677838.1 hypothetical protein [Apibacter sp. B3919]MXO25210.1 hypothetical protein [Apibacter sp. B3924]MXO27413.1 hypothetical protein [Apibacter sp. B3813]MXO29226.1 hypothetical protein [Apibacter sp. B3913]MXO31271.1 hypothetical protein [Apibacter sp. B3912]
MKKKILMIGLFITILLSGLKYLDLCVSEKYETQLEGLNPTENQIKKAKELKEKIEINKRIALYIITLSLVSIYPISLIKK